MAANKGKELLGKQFDEVLCRISEKALPWRRALEGIMSPATFNRLIDSDTERLKRYVRACEQRADIIAEEALDIADEYGISDIRPTKEHIERDRLRVDTRKWFLAKLHPKKYGDKLSTEITGKGGKDLIPGMDLSKLTLPELKSYHALLAKANATAD